MKTLVENILDKHYDAANEQLAESFKTILEQKLVEAKKRYAAKLSEGTKEDYQKVNDIANSFKAMAQEPIQPMGQGSQGAPKMPDINAPGVPDMFKVKDPIKEANLLAVQKNRLQMKSPTARANNRKPPMSLKEDEPVVKPLNIPKNMPSDEDLNKSMEDLKRSTKDEGGFQQQQRLRSGMSQVAEETEQLDEAPRVAVVKLRIRNGQVQRRKKVSNVPGMTLRAGKLTRMSPAERRRRKLGAKKAARKTKAKRSQILRKRKMSLMKRARLGG